MCTIRFLSVAVVQLLLQAIPGSSQASSCPLAEDFPVGSANSTDLCEQVYRINCDDHRISSGFVANLKTQNGVPAIGLVTALHGVANCKTISAANSKRSIYNLVLTDVDLKRDIAFLTSSSTSASSYLPTQTALPKTGGSVRILGYPEGSNVQWDLAMIPRAGPLLKLSDLLNDQDRQALSARKSPDVEQEVMALMGPIQPGLSGSPVLTEGGQVLAVANGGLGLGSDIGWAIPYSEIEWDLARADSSAIQNLSINPAPPLVSYKNPASVPALYYTNSLESPGRIYELQGGKSTAVYQRPQGRIYAIAVSSSGNIFFCDANTNQILELQGDRESVVYTHQTYVRDIGFDPSGRLYFSEASGARADGKIFILDLSSGIASLNQTVRLSDIGSYWAGDFAFDLQGVLWLSNGNRIPASLYKLVAGHPQRVFTSAAASIVGFVFDRNDSLIYADMRSIYSLSLHQLKRTQIYQAGAGSSLWGVGFAAHQ